MSQELKIPLDHRSPCSAGWDLEADCTCGLMHRIHLQTEQTMHAAWRKRAEEAEAQLAQPEADSRQLYEALKLIAEHEDKTLLSMDHDSGYSVGANRAFNQLAGIARAAIRVYESRGK